MNRTMPYSPIQTSKGFAAPAYLALGYGLFGLGFAGIFLPLLPTTVFWIGAAYCFARSSPRMRQRILDWPKIGPAVHDFLAFGTIHRSGKIAAAIGMGACAMIVVAFVPGLLIKAAGLAGISIGAVVVWSRPEVKPLDPYRASDHEGCPFLAAMERPFPASETFRG